MKSAIGLPAPNAASRFAAWRRRAVRRAGGSARGRHLGGTALQRGEGEVLAELGGERLQLGGVRDAAQPEQRPAGQHAIPPDISLLGARDAADKVWRQLAFVPSVASYNGVFGNKLFRVTHVK